MYPVFGSEIWACGGKVGEDKGELRRFHGGDVSSPGIDKERKVSIFRTLTTTNNLKFSALLIGRIILKRNKK
jgi:hypothetical protein